MTSVTETQVIFSRCYSPLEKEESVSFSIDHGRQTHDKSSCTNTSSSRDQPEEDNFKSDHVALVPQHVKQCGQRTD